MASVHLTISGIVQGVGYRYWLSRRARERDLHGWVRNRRDGTVEALVAGEEGAVDEFVELCRSGGPPGAMISELTVEVASVEEEITGFSILPDAE